MQVLSVSQAAKKWGISERSVRNDCAEERVVGAIRVEKTWTIPEDAEKPTRKVQSDARSDTLLEILQREKRHSLPGGIYHKVPFL